VKLTACQSPLDPSKITSQAQKEELARATSHHDDEEDISKCL
jgi:hypothetical protein